MSNNIVSATAYFELFLTGLKDEYDSLLAEIKMATHATVLDYEHIGTRIGFLSVMQILGENGNALLSGNFEKLNDDELDLLKRQPERFLSRMIDVAEDACRTDHVKQQITDILKRDFPMLNAARTLDHVEEGAEKAGTWLRKVIDAEPTDEPVIDTSEEPLMIVR